MTHNHYNANRDNIKSLPMVDIFLRSEALLERRLAGLALCQPKAIAGSTVRPEIDLAAKEFFSRFDRRRADILAADELTAITIAYSCCPSNRDFDRFYAATAHVNAFQEAPHYGQELVAMRTARKAVMWLQKSPLAREVAKEVVTYA